ncbi:hypothetical protein [Spirosoma linguale]|uniref:PD-(D/E)XK nuclease superfamily protein n=1 Tax=Spirosoma linguale (strain ATCC 33905 / DSM 74 / LMG 10896 / Claus 1) TaxID=504472 RepID=D2QLF1_SPILD|nr:conserved hypothetical protein [Spirosoma linguale DSM 74]
MAQLSIYGKPITSFFQLLGDNENDISYSIGWALSQSPSFLRSFIQAVTGKLYDLQNLAIHLQAYQRTKGFTDFELILPGEFHLIIEAKKGWTYPTYDQLYKYATREDFVKSKATVKKLIVFTDCSRDYNNAFFTNREVSGYEVTVFSYSEIYQLVQWSQADGSNTEKRLLIDLRTYLETLITMQDKTSNLVWVVSLGEGHASFSSLNFRQIVEQKKLYFHPIGGSYRKEPPNYIAFRFDGKLQAVHHVDSFEVFKNPSQIDPSFDDTELECPYFVYRLGRPIPSTPIPNGHKIVMANRVECMLDTLLTSSTISDALDLTKERLQSLAES